jgi:hypothetical protein
MISLPWAHIIVGKHMNYQRILKWKQLQFAGAILPLFLLLGLPQSSALAQPAHATVGFLNNYPANTLVNAVPGLLGQSVSAVPGLVNVPLTNIYNGNPTIGSFPGLTNIPLSAIPGFDLGTLSNTIPGLDLSRLGGGGLGNQALSGLTLQRAIDLGILPRSILDTPINGIPGLGNVTLGQIPGISNISLGAIPGLGQTSLGALGIPGLPGIPGVQVPSTNQAVVVPATKASTPNSCVGKASRSYCH